MPPQPTLRTDRLLLRPFRLDDAASVQQLAGAREVADTTLSIPHPYLDGMAETWIGTHADTWERQERVTFAITSEADGVVGAITLRLTLPHRRAELLFAQDSSLSAPPRIHLTTHLAAIYRARSSR
jgi:ribosomal-protein-alanine N-acetyltransferase